MKGIGMTASAISFFAEPAMFRPCRNSLAPLMLSHSGGFFEDFIKTDLGLFGYTSIWNHQ
ncbi:hypothetical protein SAMN05216464_106161 [Mucilaginibacter pineti]|uniref:Uncharacterized protein n=1 Tax=Mucilaginibacter pineti TaxID=1391627 RepID=A0A1G7D0G1_9SPHI|nr:hypothetical protein SAMN05216464_106161 [Mucilaginibacter pineti]